MLPKLVSGKLEVRIVKTDFLYRYISFETFVGMVQNSSLTFVLPSIWDDPQEESPFVQLLNKKSSAVEAAFFIGSHNKTYAQSWSKLSESDAMWRIYSYNNRAIRVRVTKDKLSLLDNVKIVPVTYSDSPFDCETVDENSLFTSLAYKRKAFEHEKEVRLISSYKYKDEQDAQQHIKAVFIQYKHKDRWKMLESMFPKLEFEEQMDKVIELLNKGNKRKETKEISYAHIPDFIDGVMVHPLAPEWYVEIVKEFCKRNNVCFEGKSKLYIK